MHSKLLLSLAAAGLLFANAAHAQDAAPAAQPAAPAAPPAPTVTFTGGASSISEGHQDWTLICGIRSNARACVFNQSLGDEKSGQRVVAMEFEPGENGGVEGTLMMPFGLRLSEGVKLLVGDVPVGTTVPFASCYEGGCRADFTLDAGAVDLLKRGRELKIAAVAQDSGENVVLTASLAGFSSALARSVALVQ